ncbi:hypothetical protein SmJEL517_g04756 [Synchytrium microbalum]|uniref:Uncharacterized protein n=1 Tax=Synchytrium microbalum TaxID=1806994 RepID=A0A507BYZ7_9FUNG|nr:uncharacterized protein SmJEL517_g04756 [Synchytrium microbalum]TPX32089.1 hypothetical protein SmJEL517_g04756 [Synchytrium microbalum]
MGDADLLRRLFQENNELKVKVNSLSREIFNRGVQYENAEEEIRLIKLKLEQAERGALSTPGKSSDGHKLGHNSSQQVSKINDTDSSGVSKELEEAMRLLDRRNSELKQMREDLSRAHANAESLRLDKEKIDKELNGAQAELVELHAFRTSSQKQMDEQRLGQSKDGVSVTHEEFLQTKLQLQSADRTVEGLKRQLLELANESNRKYNEQQNQLQGADALIESIRREYDEFIQITKLENDAIREAQLAEYNELKLTSDRIKMEAHAERKRLLHEYQTILYSMQAQFEEFRVTSEFVYNTDMDKLADAIKSQSQRYEHQLLYVIQAKDKFYSDMMVAKDAKIMSLIEGSDMQSIMQKHEMEMEAMRKEHIREIDRVRQEQDSEQKSLVSLLQRQSANLEAKCDKLQQHSKALESRLRDMMTTVENKNRLIAEKDEVKAQQDSEFSTKIEDASRKMRLLTQEKEHLRHRIIRMNLDARGEGDNSLDSMVKRLTRETAGLQSLYDDLASKYETTLAAEQVATRRAKEKAKLVEYLEKECARRNAEYQSMVRTFEEFLQRRAKQGRDDATRRSRLLSGIHETSNTSKPDFMADPKGILKAHIPKPGDASPSMVSPTNSTALDKSELERGYTYLRRFKTLSRAFATGDLRAVHLPGAPPSAESIPGPWQKIPLYKQLEDVSLAVAKIYEPPPELSSAADGPHEGGGTRTKIPVYMPDTNENKSKLKQIPDVKLYKTKEANQRSSKSEESQDSPVKDDFLCVVGGNKKSR